MAKAPLWPLAAGVSALLTIPPMCFAQLDTPQSLSQRGTQAYEAKDFATFLSVEKQLLAYAPEDPRVIYNVACGEAIAGHAAASVEMLDRLVARGLDVPTDKDKDFDKIRQTPQWLQFKERLAKLHQPLVHSTTAFTIPDKGLMAAGIAVDEHTGDIYIASVRERKILKRTKDGVLSDFATQKDGLLSVLYLQIDSQSRQLYASTAALPAMLGFRKEDENTTGVCVFDLTTGKLLRKAFLSGGQERHFLGAMALSKSGEVFVVDTGSSEIYRVRRGSSELELFVSSVVFRAPTSVALSADDATLYVSDFAQGLFAIEVLSIDRRHLEAPPGVLMNGITGLTRVPDGFIALQTGIQPNRVVRIRLDSKGEQIASVETLESSHPSYSGPIAGAVAGGDFVYVANSQFALVNTKTGVFDQEHAQPTTVLSLPLGK